MPFTQGDKNINRNGRPKGSKNKMYQRFTKINQIEDLIYNYINGKYYVYYHVNNNTDEVFYIGKGKNHRAWDYEARNDLWKKYTIKNEFRVHLLCSNLNENEALAIEKSLIKVIKPLTNKVKYYKKDENTKEQSNNS